MVVIDGKGMVLGRLASKVAKMLLNGESVEIINSEAIIISGDKQYILNKYLERRRLKNKANPEKSPKWPRVPNLLVRRIIRGMLPRKKARGREAYKRLRVYIGNPQQKEGIVIEEAKPKNITKYITVGELCRLMGWTG